ncbi:MAG: hypothetical protein AAFQ37_06895, partial [Bacteroidota bacterium]
RKGKENKCLDTYFLYLFLNNINKLIGSNTKKPTKDNTSVRSSSGVIKIVNKNIGTNTAND